MSERSRLGGLLGGSALLLLTVNLANALHFVFHLVMARMLGPAGYGVLAALLACLYVLNVIAESVQTVLARYASRAGSAGRVHTLLARSLRRAARATLPLLGVWLLAAVALAHWLHIPYPLSALFSLALAGVVLLPVNRGVLQGTRRFGALGINFVLEVGVKLGLGMAAVALGWKEAGAVGAVGLSLCAAFALSFPPLRDLLRAPAEPAEDPDLHYGLPVLAVTATVMVFYSLDVLLARAFFPAAVAGRYAIASFLAKGILLGTMPVTRAMFPIATEAAERRGDVRRVLAGALAILAACLAPALAVFALVPDRLVRLAAGPGYGDGDAAAVLLPLGVALSLMSVSNALLLWRLSLGRPRFWAALPLLVAMELAALLLFHGSLREYALAVAGSNVLFLAASALFAAGAAPPAPE